MNMKKKGLGWKSDLTCERLGDRFSSMFDLVKYAKNVAEGMVFTDHLPESENVAAKILENIADKKEVIYEVRAETEEDSAVDAAIQAAQALNAGAGASVESADA